MKLCKRDDTKEQRKFLEQMVGKRVEYVMQSTMQQKIKSLITQIVSNSPDGMSTFPYLLWRGETTDGYFRIIFYAGVVVMVFSEREIYMDHIAGCHIACVPEFLEIMESSAVGDRVSKNIQYMVNEYPKQMENIKFNDIMKILGWKFAKKGTKVEMDWINS